jgi:hypothetical protein
MVIVIAAAVVVAVLLTASATWWWLRAPEQSRDMRRADRASAQATSAKEMMPLMMGRLGMAGNQLLRNGAGMVRHNRFSLQCLACGQLLLS